MDIKLPYVLVRPVEYCQSSISIIEQDNKMLVRLVMSINVDGKIFTFEDDFNIIDMSNEGYEYDIAREAVHDLQMKTMKDINLEGDTDDHWTEIYEIPIDKQFENVQALWVLDL